MASKLADASSLSWIWVIEALASFDQVDISLLIDLVKRAPAKISGHVGKNARERVSLRILESLSVQKIGVTCGVSSDPDSNFAPNPSECCENVLRQHLPKYSEPGDKSTEWNVEPFLQYKRTCLPKCALQQLKDAILEDNIVIPTFLKERSSVVFSIQSDGNTLRPECGHSDAQEVLPSRNLLPSKRVKNGLASDVDGGEFTQNQVIVDNACDPHSHAAKKFRWDGIYTQPAIEGQESTSYPKSITREDVSVRNLRQNGEVSDVPKEPQVEGLEEIIFFEDDNDDSIASKMLRTSYDVDNRLETPCNNEKLPQETFGDGQGQTPCVEESKEDSEGCAELRTSCGASQAITQQNTSVFEIKDRCGHSLPLNPPNSAYSCETQDNFTDSNGYHHKLDNLKVKKYSFLNSQCTCGQDALLTGHGSEHQICMKCKKGGQLLNCSFEACPIVVHERCLGVANMFDATASFYCPFCAYSQAISEYMDFKKRVSSARYDLTALIASKVEYGQKDLPKGSYGEDHNRFGEDLDEGIGPNSADNVGNSQCMGNTKYPQQADPSARQDRAITNERTNICQSSREQEEQDIAKKAFQNCEMESAFCRVTEIAHWNY